MIVLLVFKCTFVKVEGIKKKNVDSDEWQTLLAGFLLSAVPWLR